MTDNGKGVPPISHEYRYRLFHWAIVQHLLNSQHRILARFHRRSDADGHLNVLQTRQPDGQFEVIFEL